MRAVLNGLGKVGLTTMPFKCQLGIAECTYLGHAVGNCVVKSETAKLQALKQFPQPTTKKKVRSFLGLTSYYHRFIPSYATFAAPLTELVRKHEPERVRWSEGSSKAFCKLKEKLLAYPVIRNVNFSLTFTLQVDASDVRVGVVLSKTDEKGWDHLVTYFNRKVLPREQRYAASEKECLAIKLGVEAFSTYLIGSKLTIQSGHRALQWLSRSQDCNCRLMKWSIALQPYQFKVVHHHGSENTNADALSLIPSAFIEGGRGVKVKMISAGPTRQALCIQRRKKQAGANKAS